VLQRAGGVVVNLPGGELFTSLKTGVIDATEWVGPYNDLALGLYKAAKYYYYPGWHEPGTTLEAVINEKAYKALDKDLQSIVRNACKVVNQDMVMEYAARNNEALNTLVNKHKVDLRKLPDDVLAKTEANFQRTWWPNWPARNAMSKRIYDSYQKFYKECQSMG